MEFWNVLLHFISLDLTWIATYLYSNIAFIFMMFATIYIAQKGKNVIFGFLLFSAIILISRDLAPMFNLAIYTSAGLMLLYLLRVSSLTFIIHTGYAKYLKLVWYGTFFLAIYIYNVFMVG